MSAAKIIVLVFIVAGWYHAASQLPGYKSFKLADDGKPFKINTLYKTHQGYIYAGTTAGLFSFDGVRFKKIPFTLPGVKDTVTAIFEDNTNKLWIGCKSGRIAQQVNQSLQFIEPEEGLPKVAITSFTQDAQHNIWFGTNGEGIYYFSNKRLYLINEEEGLPDKYIHALAAADNGDVLAATDQGLVSCNIAGNKKNLTVINPGNGLPDYYVTAIAPAGNNQFWIGTQEKGFCLYNHNNKNITVPAVISNWSYGQINSILHTPNSLWIATEEHGIINILHNAGVVTQPFAATAENKNITSVLQDKEGNVWMSSPTALLCAATDKLRLLPFYSSDTYQTIHTILADKENNIWVGTDGGLIKYNRNNTLAKKYPIPALTAKTDITCLYQDIYANIWVSTMGEGIFVLDPVSGSSRNITENALLKKASVLSISGSGNTVCAGGLEGVATIFNLTPDNASINNTYSFTNYNNIPNIGNNYIHTVFKDSKRRIWFGTDGKGITVLHNGNFTHYGKADGLLDEHIYTFTEDATGNIWFNTKDAGIYCYNGKHFKNYSTAQGLSDLKITALKTDKQGNIIIANEKGIDILQPSTGTVSYIDNVQGLAVVNTDMHSVATDTAQNILLTTAAGIAVYTPVKNAILQPVCVIDNVQLFAKAIDTTASHTFKHNENSFTFNFTGLYYTNPEKVKYQYKLQGWDTIWVTTKDRSIPFPNLRPGKYVFYVRASINDNFENADTASYAFSITTPFWKQLWFIALCVLTAAALLYWYIKYREKEIKKLQQLQQEKIQFQMQLLGSQVNPHFLFNSFNTLIAAIEDDPKNAVDYVEQLSAFFRNIVNYRDKDIISLGEEINLLNTYFYLQQKRYGANLQLTIEVPDDAKAQWQIPPLTLQLLMENAVKHNAVSKEAPLKVQLYIEDDMLVMKNNCNVKKQQQPGTGMGLQNIFNRYKLLSGKAVMITNTAEYFLVKLPQLKNS